MKALHVICKIAAVVLGTLPALLFVYWIFVHCAGVSPSWGTCVVLGLAGLIAAFYRFDFGQEGFSKKFCLFVAGYLAATWAVVLLSLPHYTYDDALKLAAADQTFAGYTVTQNNTRSTEGLLKPKPSHFINSYYLLKAVGADETVKYVIVDPVSGDCGFCDNEIITLLASR